MVHYDYIFAGGGCAAYSMLFYLSKSKLKSKRILVIDPMGDDFPNKTWCYWAKSPLEIQPESETKFWNKLNLSKNGSKLTLPLGDLNYYHVEAGNFFKELKAYFSSIPSITFLEEKITNIYPTSQNFEIETDSGESFTCDYLLDSRLEEVDFQNQKILKQQFVGWKIKTEQPFFDDSAVTLMDILPQDQKNFSFGYILPYDSKHALVEYTAYSEEAIPKENLKASLDSYLEKHLQNVEYSVYFEETGAIPMSTQYKTVQTHERWIPIGTRAGWSRPSTGYTFQFIQEHCQKLVNELELDLALSKKSIPSRHFFYDNILLNIAKKWPEQLENVFFDLFTVNSTENVLRFLQAKTSFWEEINLLRKVRFAPYLKSLWYYEKH
ncbi:lycopene cyclase family protein [uncultured Algoriphagus sp.]|uniref:lycopene cyclase family protein n=1 Tax=uncultured Algoriphagus sp. TaxID=417365 RepID=UPI0025886BCF|nr:lycopene cyclase family protein [uncultured Algoriphagus sp.]